MKQISVQLICLHLHTDSNKPCKYICNIYWKPLHFDAGQVGTSQNISKVWFCRKITSLLYYSEGCVILKENTFLCGLFVEDFKASTH